MNITYKQLWFQHNLDKISNSLKQANVLQWLAFSTLRASFPIFFANLENFGNPASSYFMLNPQIVCGVISILDKLIVFKWFSQNKKLGIFFFFNFLHAQSRLQLINKKLLWFRLSIIVIIMNKNESAKPQMIIVKFFWSTIYLVWIRLIFWNSFIFKNMYGTVSGCLGVSAHRSPVLNLFFEYID